MPAREVVALPPHLQARYGVPRTSPWVIAVGVVVTAAAVGVLRGPGLAAGQPRRCRHKLLAWQVADDSRVDVTFEMRRRHATPP